MSDCVLRVRPVVADVIEPQVNYWNKWKYKEPNVPTSAPISNLLVKPNVISPQVNYFKRFGITAGKPWKVRTRAQAISAAFNLPSTARIDPASFGITDLTTEEKFRGTIPLTLKTFARIISSSFKKNIELLKQMNEGKSFSVIVNNDTGGEPTPTEDDLDPEETKTAVVNNTIEKITSGGLDAKEIEEAIDDIAIAAKGAFAGMSTPDDFKLKDEYVFDEISGARNNEILNNIIRYLAVNAKDPAFPVSFVTSGSLEQSDVPRRFTTLLNDIGRKEYGLFRLNLVEFKEIKPADWRRRPESLERLERRGIFDAARERFKKMTS